MGSPDFSPEAVYRVLRALPRTCSSGPDELPNIFLQSCASALVLPLSHILSTSFLDSRLPMDWKIALILPIHKKRPTSDPSNHRPISISSTYCRVMEHLVIASTSSTLIQNSLISPHQHGFMPSRSACGGLMESTWDWVQGLLFASGFTDVVYLDFRKAFDTVSHSKLLCKLLSYCIQGLNFLWIKDFLSDRTQYVQLEGVCSSPSPVTSGVQQGSVLGLTLFNDILDQMNGLPITCKLYADDLKIYCRAADRPDLHFDRSDLHPSTFDRSDQHPSTVDRSDLHPSTIDRSDLHSDLHSSTSDRSDLHSDQSDLHSSTVDHPDLHSDRPGLHSSTVHHPDLHSERPLLSTLNDAFLMESLSHETLLPPPPICVVDIAVFGGSRLFQRDG